MSILLLIFAHKFYDRPLQNYSKGAFRTPLKDLPYMITRQQTIFVEGRQILDASLLANELIDEWKMRNQKIQSFNLT